MKGIMKKKWIMVLVTLSMLGSMLVGCGTSEDIPAEVEAEEVKVVAAKEAEQVEEETEKVETENENGRKVVTDHMGREVEIPEDIKRPVALTANLMEGLYIIGLEPVATVDNYRIRPEADQLPKLGVQGNINVEAVYAVEPDFIVAHYRHQGQMVDALEEIGVPVFVIDPAQVGDAPLYDSALYLGSLLGREDAAQAFVNEVEEKAAALAEQIYEETEIRTGLILEDGDSIRAAQSASGYGAVLTGLGIENILPEDMPGVGQQSFVPFDIETIIAADPDVILIRPASNDQEQNRQRLASYVENPIWAELTAVKNGNIHMLPFRMHPGRATADEMYQMTANVILSNQ